MEASLSSPTRTIENSRASRPAFVPKMLIEKYFLPYTYHDIVNATYNDILYDDHDNAREDAFIFFGIHYGPEKATLLEIKNDGADINQKKDDHTVLHEACGVKQSVAACEHLVKIGADVNVTDKDGNTPLHLACSRGNVKIAKILLKADAKPDEFNYKKITPLMLAVDHKNATGKKENFKLLAEADYIQKLTFYFSCIIKSNAITKKIDNTKTSLIYEALNNVDDFDLIFASNILPFICYL